MTLGSHPFYKEFEDNLNSCISKKASLLIESIPGMGVSYFIKKFLERNHSERISYINEDGKTLSDFNILDLDLNKNKEALKMADRYFKKATIKQKFALVINAPYILDSEEYKNSFVSSHIYSTYYFKPFDPVLIKIFAKELETNLSKSEAEKIDNLSGGHARTIKFLISNKVSLSFSVDDLLENQDLRRAIYPTIEVIKRTSNEILEKFGIVEKGVFKGGIFRRYFEINPRKQYFNIQISPDFSFSENGQVSKEYLLKVERRIIEEVVSSGGMITKEKVADYKWGEGSYDKYSDQAIAKSIQRFNSKLKYHKLVAVPTIGYRLIAEGK